MGIVFSPNLSFLVVIFSLCRESLLFRINLERVVVDLFSFLKALVVLFCAT